MTDIDADHDRSPARSATAVILAVVFLAVIGAVVGFVLARGAGPQGSDGAGDSGATTSGTPAAPTAAATAATAASTRPAQSGGGNPTAKTTTRSSTPTKSYRPTTREQCPQQTQEAANAGELHVTLYIRTRSSEVWICSNGSRNFYQGHLRGRSFPAATSDSSLYISGPRYEAGVWAATNGSVVYYVSPDRLRREEGGTEVSNEPVEETYGG